MVNWNFWLAYGVGFFIILGIITVFILLYYWIQFRKIKKKSPEFPEDKKEIKDFNYDSEIIERRKFIEENGNTRRNEEDIREEIRRVEEEIKQLKGRTGSEGTT